MFSVFVFINVIILLHHSLVWLVNMFLLLLQFKPTLGVHKRSVYDKNSFNRIVLTTVWGYHIVMTISLLMLY